MHDIFLKASNQLQHHLPFVLYKQPSSSILQAFFMKEDTPYSTDFQEAGFCFFPFDAAQQNYFFPYKKSLYNEVQLTDLKLNNDFIKSDTLIEEDEDEKRKHIQLISETIHHLKKEEYQKIVLSRPIHIPFDNINALAIFERLLVSYPTAMVYMWYHPHEGIWIGATPETLVQFKSKQLKTMALAGTRVYREGFEPDWKDKEREEQELVSTYIQQKLKPFSNHLKISPTYSKQAGNLVHLNTDISARIDVTKLEEVILSLHPTPAVCGLPTQKAKEYILQNEHYNRSFYTGFLGEIQLPKEKSRSNSKRNQEALAIKQLSRETNLYVNLRCMKVEDNYCKLFVGGGITSASNATDEWKETRYKSETLLKVL